MPLRALIVDDDPEVVQVVAEFIEREGLAVAARAGSLREARERIAASPPDVLLVDIYLPDGSGLDLQAGLDTAAGPPVVLITGNASVDTAVDALRHGAADYLTKPVDFARLRRMLEDLGRARWIRAGIQARRMQLRRRGRFGPLVGASPAMQDVYDLIRRVAPTDASVFITGETGTGKEVVAQAIHRLSRRRKEAFVPVSSVAPDLIESELFGHERGSFTGADRMHKGCFERAHRGTLFLDEITEMPIALQVKLLRTLESSAVARVGGSQTIEVDVRVIAATNRRLEDAVAAGKLREDLLYRLNVFPIALPPLRERGRDVELLAEHFLRELNAAAGTAKQLTPAARDRLCRHVWPGNVRELKNVVQRGFILAAEGGEVDILPPAGGEEAVPASSLTVPVGTSIAAAERLLILATLERFQGDKRKAATALQIGVNTLYGRLREYGANPRPSRDRRRPRP